MGPLKKLGSTTYVAAAMAAGLIVCSVIAADAAPAAVGSAAAHATASARHRVVANHCKKSKKDVPRCGVLWGAYLPPVPGAGEFKSGYPSLESEIGRRLDIVKHYEGWQPGKTFPNAVDAALGAHHRVLDYSWNAQNYDTRAKISYRSIAAGDWDSSVILPEARALKHFHHKVFIDFDHEFDNKAQQGKGSPAEYVAAYRHIHRVMHKAGVKNVIWTWVSTGYVGNASVIKASYPGRKYVNWIGYDPYNFASCHSEGWRGPYNTFAPFYRWVRHQPGMSKKPLFLGEYATVLGSRAGAWYSHVAKALKHLPRIKAVMQWSSATSSRCDFRLSDSASALAGFKKSGDSNYILGKH